MERSVKCLLLKNTGGILAGRIRPDHVRAVNEYDIPPIDMVVVNLYPFAQAVARPDCTMEDAIENIDIGGPAMVRAAAKNHAFVAVVTDPADYKPLIEKMKASKGKIGFDERFALAVKAFSHTVDGDTATAVAKQFVEVVIAPAYSPEALKVFAAKLNVRLLAIEAAKELNRLDMKRVGGGLLVQTSDDYDVAQLRIVTRRDPTKNEMNDLIFAFRVAKFVKSNAIVFCSRGMTLGVGAGQMSRVDSTRIAAIKAKNAGLALRGSVVASDAFFPFRDGLDVVAGAGASAVIQPGGSVRDAEVIAAADEHGMAMVFTGMRHFRH